MVQVSRELLGAPTRGVRRSRVGSRALLDESEIRHAGVFSRSLARIAATDEAVRRFRTQVLGGEPLAADEAQRALSSPALYLLSPKSLRSLSMPIRHHEARVEHRRAETKRRRWKENVKLTLTWQSRSKAFEFSIRRSIHDGMWLEVPPQLWGRVTPFGQYEPFVRRGSLFDQLRKAGAWLVQRFPWKPWDAVWFVLTGAPPPVPPIEIGVRSWSSQTGGVQTFRRSVLTLTVDPWLSAKSLARVYRAHQKELLGARIRGLGANLYVVFEFVLRHEGPEGRCVSWSRLWKAWNRAHPDRRYGDYRNFRSDYVRARNALMLLKTSVIRPIRLG